MKRLATLALIFVLHPALAAVPLRWTVETSRAKPETFDEFAGATYDLEATLQSYGRPLEVVGEPRLYWQTNGMGSAYWTAPATVSGNVLRATWTPACDVGARAYNCFIGITGTVYNAAFQLRLRPSPGAVPNVITEPPRVLDLEHTIVINPPWPTDATIDSSIRRVIHEDGITAEVNPAEIKGMVSTTVDKAYVESLGISTGLDTNTVADIANNAISTNATVFNLMSNVSSLESSKLDNTGGEIRGDGYDTGVLNFTVDSNPNPYLLISGNGVFSRDLYNFNIICSNGSFSYYEPEDEGAMGAFNFEGASHPLRVDGVPVATTADLEPLSTDIAQAYTWSRNVYKFITGDSSCHFSATNYVSGSEAVGRTRFSWADDMDPLTVPSSMCLRDIRDGQTNVVWDARDWTVWYFNYRLAKYREERATEDDALRALIAQRAPLNWSSFTACGLTNPATTTTWFDTPSVVLSAGYAWQHQLDVGGVGYWCIEGNGFDVGGSGTNATLKISDFEGNEVFKIRKGNAMLAPVTSEMTEAVGFDDSWFWCDMKCDAQPEGEFAIDIADGFYPEGDTCPAVVREYEDRGSGVWRCYWKVKPGIQSDACFGRFKVQVGSETTVEYSNAPTFPAIRFGNYKLEPVIPSGAHVGDTVTFKITEITQ